MKPHARDTRIGACADYLIGMPVKDVGIKWGIHPVLLTYWIRKVGCFKLCRESLQDKLRPDRI